MLPKSTATSTGSVHINPKFRNVHINPQFINKTTNVVASNDVPLAPYVPSIHINPKFIASQNVQTSQHSLENAHDGNNAGMYQGGIYHPDNRLDQFSYTSTEPLADTKIHSRKKIIKTTPTTAMKTTTDQKTNKLTIPEISQKKLIRVGSKKIIRVDNIKMPSNKPVNESKTSTTLRRPLQTKYKIVKKQTAFKIDRRSRQDLEKALLTRKTSKINSIRKTSINESLGPQITVHRNISSVGTILKPTAHTNSIISRQSAFLSINGILYKTNHRKLEKQHPATSSNMPNHTKQSNYHRISVRGENFSLDANGRNLVRETTATSHAIQAMPTPSIKSIRRIDIGKITFVRNSNGTFERTDYHKDRFHLNVAKQRSIQLLTSRLVKSNVPCLIYRKLGKCVAYERGKCTKLHDNKFVDICARFLRGACEKKDCLLSHKTTLSKMPTCKFYLLGLCTKDDCPYLHRKVTEQTEICSDFLNGYCEKAEECLKRHDFVRQDDTNKKSRKNVLHQTKQLETSARPNTPVSKSSTSAKHSIADCSQSGGITRYYDKDHVMEVDDKIPTVDENTDSSVATEGQSNGDTDLPNIKRKKRIGTLPSFIPIG